ncbi:MAG: hypothetical protein HYY30_05830 [Chloroflexi bacterium]|nr:hypothetical protein [Chloroflexota bacterium]
MHHSPVRLGFAGACLSLLTVLALFLVSLQPAFAVTGPDYAVPTGWFFTQTGGGQGQGYAVQDGTDVSGKPVKFWTEFQRLGGISTLGYPIGQPYVGSDGFTYQPFQRGVLQWRPEQGSAVLANTFEMLQSAGRDGWLAETKGIPKPVVDDGSNGDYAKAVATRSGWLTDDAIRTKYLANPNPSSITGWNRDRAIELYGLPMSQPEKHGPFISQRFQRISFQLWVEDVPGMPTKGSVVGVLGGDLMNEAGLLPATATQPLGPGGTPPLVVVVPTAVPTVQATPIATPPPPPPAAASYPWRVTYANGFPNCGTTYIRAYARDASGNGVNGMALKSWNDWGNEYVAGTRNYNGQDGYWDRVISPGVQAGKWYVMLVDGSGNQSSDIATINFTGSCEPGQGNVQEAEVEFKAR